MLKLGITGSMGCGKSTVASVLAAMSFPVFVSDAAARRAMVESISIKRSLMELFGTEIYSEDGILQRSLLAEHLFQSEVLVQKVNGIVHPVVEKMFQNWVQQQVSPALVVKEAAILYESGSYLDLDEIWVVTCPEEIRFQRIRERNGWDDAQIKARMKHQWPEEKKAALANAVIVNDGKQAVLPQILSLLSAKNIKY